MGLFSNESISLRVCARGVSRSDQSLFTLMLVVSCGGDIGPVPACLCNGVSFYREFPALNSYRCFLNVLDLQG
jgi:hypothetical protein